MSELGKKIGNITAIVAGLHWPLVLQCDILTVY